MRGKSVGSVERGSDGGKSVGSLEGRTGLEDRCSANFVLRGAEVAVEVGREGGRNALECGRIGPVVLNGGDGGERKTGVRVEVGRESGGNVPETRETELVVLRGGDGGGLLV
jgi:hypothetical protein